MKRTIYCLVLSVAAGSAGLIAQSTPFVSNSTDSAVAATNGGFTSPRANAAKLPPDIAPAPFSRLAFGGGVSAMGINMQAAVNANRYMNVRGTGNFFNYTVNNISVNGLNLDGKLNMASAGASVDFYPFPYHGFRVSPGVLFYNQNAVSSTITAPGGTSFTLDGYTYYSSEASPAAGTANLGLNKQNPAFTITTGWGNLISRTGGHLSFPFEIGAAMIGAPTLNMALTSGQVCANPQGTVGCMSVVGNSTLDSNLQGQVAKYQNDLNPLRFYPIVSFGVGYNFKIRGAGATRVAAR